jgi:hypothetical protein
MDAMFVRKPRRLDGGDSQRSPRGIGWLVGLCLWLGGLSIAQAVEIEAVLDRNPVPINESFTLSLIAELEPDGDPDFSPLNAHFEILNQSRGSQYSSVNGSIHRKYTWQLQLIAKESGTLEIPALNFGKDRSKALSVTVTWSGGSRNRVPGPPGASPNGTPDGPGALLELEATPKNPYVQAQVVVTVRVLSRVAFSGDLGQPEIPGILLEKLDPDRQYSAVRNGLQYRVDERRYAMFPQKSGPLTIPPVELTGEYVDAMLGLSPRTGQRKFRLRSDAFNLDVRPIPAAFTGKVWLPASKLSLKEIWKPDTATLTAGDAVTRTLTIRAESVSAGVLPEWDLGVSSQEFRQYPDQPVTKEDKTGTGMTSQRDQKIALIPVGPGKFTLPALEIPWWNTTEDKMDVARLPARTFTVTPGTGKAPVVPDLPSLGATDATLKPEAESADAKGFEAPASSDGNPFKDPWFWSSVGLLLGWLTTLAVWFFKARQRPRDAEDRPPEKSAQTETLRITDAFKQLKKACEAEDRIGAREALKAFSLERWPNLDAEGRHSALKDLLGGDLETLDRGLYGQAEAPWDGRTFFKRIEARLVEESQKPQKTAPNLLESLYKA